METITRIHIARTPFDIEVAAKTKLEHYLDAVRRGLDDDTAEEVMQDIELRITELLAERKVVEGGVITAKDVRFIEEQLGAPDQFTDEAKTVEAATAGPRRLLRDMDNALLGGVASGLGLYFNIDPLIFRLIFVAITFAGGAGILLYILLWILVPAASSSAEKLQMQGKAVTAASLQHYRKTMSRTLRWSGTASGKIILGVLKVGVTTCAAAALLGVALTAAVATSALFTQPLKPLVWSYHTNAFVLGAMWLFALSLITLLTILIRQIWRHKFSTVMRAMFLSALAAAVISVTTLAGLTPIVATHYNNLYGNGKMTTALPVASSNISAPVTNLSLSGDRSMQVTYNVSTDPPHVTYEALPGMHRPDISVAVNGSTLNITAQDLHKAVPNCLVHSLCNNIYLPVRITVYGPAVQTIDDSSGANLWMSGLSGQLSVKAANNAVIALNNSPLTQFTADATNGASIFASSSTAQSATIHVDLTSVVFAPAASTLTATIPSSCDATSMGPLVVISNQPASVIINGVIMTGQSNELNTRCVSIDDPNASTN